MFFCNDVDLLLHHKETFIFFMILLFHTELVLLCYDFNIFSRWIDNE